MHIKNRDNSKALATLSEGTFIITQNEKQALESIVSPFIVYYVRSFRDECFIYFLMEFVRGKELFDVIR